MDYQVDIFGNKVPVKSKTQTKKKKLKKTEFKKKINILYDLDEQLYNKYDINLLEQREIIIKQDVIIYPQDRQAEPKDIINLTIYDLDKRIERMKELCENR